MSRHTAKGPYGVIDERDGQQELEKLIKYAPYTLERLVKVVEVVSKETNTQATATLLQNEVMDALVSAIGAYSALALMKNCRFVDYDKKTCK